MRMHARGRKGKSKKSVDKRRLIQQMNKKRKHLEL
jgi:hypothetical protein